MIIDGNLWVRRSGYTQAKDINVRDAYRTIINNWNLVLASGVQATAGSTVSTDMSINLLAGDCDWRTFGNVKASNPGQRPSVGEVKVGGNRIPVKMHETEAAATDTVKPDRCRVADSTPTTRQDRNFSVEKTNDATGADDYTTPVHDYLGNVANYNKVPHRMQAVENGFSAYRLEIGPPAWAMSFYR